MEGANTKGVIGVLGGMGPLATVDFMHKLLDATPAEFDQDHVPIVVSSIPQIPDRSAAFRGSGASPLTAMIASGRRLMDAGAELVVVPCNTAHLWFDELRAALHLPMLHIVDAALEDVLLMTQADAPIGLLCTDATMASGLYVERSQCSASPSAHRRWALPTDQEMQALVMPGIEAVKAGQSDQASGLLQQAAQALVSRGAGVLVLGCTEIPVALRAVRMPVPVVDATASLARRAVAWSLGMADLGDQQEQRHGQQ